MSSRTDSCHANGSHIVGLTHAQYPTLASLRGLTARGERPSQRRLAAWTGPEPIYVSKLVRALEQGGLIARVPDPADARAVQLTLTDRGTEVVDQAVQIVHDLHGTLTAPLGGPDSAETRALAAALQTLLRGAHEPGTTPEEGEVPMTTSPALTGRDIGQAEKATRALLDRLLEEAGLSFPEWTVLFSLDGAGPLAHSELVRRLVHGRVAPEPAARATVDRLRSSGLLAPVDQTQDADEAGGGQEPRLALTAAGEARYRPVRRAVARITEELYGDLPAADLEATQRTLAEVTRRANARLAADG